MCHGDAYDSAAGDLAAWATSDLPLEDVDALVSALEAALPADADAQLRREHAATVRASCLTASCIRAARLLDGAAYRRHEAAAREATGTTGRVAWHRLGRNGRHAAVGAHHRQEARDRAASMLHAVRAAHAATERSARDLTAFRAQRAHLDDVVALALDALHELQRTADGTQHQHTRASLVARYCVWQERLDAIEHHLLEH